MVVNASKTSMLCISDAMSFRAEGHIFGEDGTRVTSVGTQKIKVLGFHFGTKPNVDEHVKSLRILYHLKHHCFNTEELVKVYKTVIRPVFDFCAVVYHPLLTDEQDQLLERLQRQALKVIYETNLTYTEMRGKAAISTRRQRRIELSDKFAEKCLKTKDSATGSGRIRNLGGVVDRRGKNTRKVLPAVRDTTIPHCSSCGVD